MSQTGGFAASSWLVDRLLESSNTEFLVISLISSAILVVLIVGSKSCPLRPFF